MYFFLSPFSGAPIMASSYDEAVALAKTYLGQEDALGKVDHINIYEAHLCASLVA